MDDETVKSETRVLVSCSNRLLTEAIARILSKKPEFDVIPAKKSAADDLAELAGSGADVLVLDSLDAFPSSEPGEASLIAKPSCVLVAMEDNHIYFLKAIQLGVRGYVLRDASAQEVINAVRSVAQGQATCPPSYTRILFEYVAAQTVKPSFIQAPKDCDLTRRERQLVPLIGQGLTNKEIANQLHLSEQTVKNHIHRMMKKLQSTSRLEVCKAWRRQSASPGYSIEETAKQQPA